MSYSVPMSTKCQDQSWLERETGGFGTIVGVSGVVRAFLSLHGGACSFSLVGVDANASYVLN